MVTVWGGGPTEDGGGISAAGAAGRSRRTCPCPEISGRCTPAVEGHRCDVSPTEAGETACCERGGARGPAYHVTPHSRGLAARWAAGKKCRLPWCQRDEQAATADLREFGTVPSRAEPHCYLSPDVRAFSWRIPIDWKPRSRRTSIRRGDARALREPGQRSSLGSCQASGLAVSLLPRATTTRGAERPPSRARAPRTPRPYSWRASRARTRPFATHTS